MISNARRRLATSVALLETDEQSARRLAATFGDSTFTDAVAISLVDKSHGRWNVAIHFRGVPDEQAVRALAAAAAGPRAAQSLGFKRVAAKDWVNESLAGFRPVRAGRFIVHGGHDRHVIAANRIGIEIEAALAFGTGHHGTTRGCLLALDRICKTLRKARPPVSRHPEALRVTEQELRILDLGTGSGVLGIAAARALRQRVLATDLDAEAVRVARANAKLNGVGTMVEVLHADGVVAGQRLRARAPFDLVFANILLGPLQRLAAPLSKIIAPHGRVILSGLLTAQANAVIASYRALVLERRIDLDGWTTLVLARRTRPRRAVARRHRGS